MAKGTKNYFRHSVFMHQDEKLVELIKIGGFAYYGKWCVFLELMAAQEISNECKGEYVFHRQTLRKCLSFDERTLNVWLTNVERLLNVRLTFVEHSISVSYPNMLKYLGSYNSCSPNKEKKRKEIKQRAKIPKLSSFDFDDLYNLYPKKEGKKKGIENLTRIVKSQEIYDRVKNAIENYICMIHEKGTDAKFIKQFSTFTNCWEDFLDVDHDVSLPREDEPEEEFSNALEGLFQHM